MPSLKYRETPSWLSAPRRAMIAAIPLPVLRHALYRAVMGKRGNFREPETFNEKVNWRIFNDRRDRIVKACDKMWMKDMAREAYPGVDLHIPATYWSGTDLRDAPDLMSLPPWVLKPNHSSGHALFGPEPQTDLTDLHKRTELWLKDTPQEMGEWGYGAARRLLLLEERIPTADGKPPVDYKFFVFDGRIELIQVNRDRFEEKVTASFVDADWHPFPVRQADRPVVDVQRPVELEKMVEIARVLGAGWDFIRVDLYAVDGAVWFGEYTPYPGGGLLPYDPMAFDHEQGLHWKLPTRAQVQRGRP